MNEKTLGRTDRAERHISAPAATIWSAFADSQAWTAWLPPAGMTGQVEHFDFREGGTYRLRLTYDSAPEVAGKTSADADVAEGRFVKIEPGRLLVHDVVFPSDDPAYSGTMRMNWSLEPAGDSTVVTFIAENVPPGISAADHQAGFLSTLANLTALVEAKAAKA